MAERLNPKLFTGLSSVRCPDMKAQPVTATFCPHLGCQENMKERSDVTKHCDTEIPSQNFDFKEIVSLNLMIIRTLIKFQKLGYLS